MKAPDKVAGALVASTWADARLIEEMLRLCCVWGVVTWIRLVWGRGLQCMSLVQQSPPLQCALAQWGYT